jgi:hypothetical protein
MPHSERAYILNAGVVATGRASQRFSAKEASFDVSTHYCPVH